MTQEIIAKVDYREFGIQETKAQEINKLFMPMLQRMVELEKEYNEVIEMEMGSEKIFKAKEVRLKYVKARTSTSEIHRELKDFYLKGGRFVDSWKNAQKLASESKEITLKEIELYHENLEKERIKNLQNKREKAISLYLEGDVPSNLGEMESDVWEAYFSTKKLKYEQRIEEEKQLAEKQRLEEVRRALEIEEQRKENERLKKIALQKEKELEKERKKSLELKKKIELEQKIQRQKEEKERLEKEEQERLKKLAELEEKKRIEEAKKAPLKEQLKNWVKRFELPTTDISNDTTKDILVKFDNFKLSCFKEIEKI
jgi:hypothetical protein